MSEPSKAIFLSYASQDADAAQRIAEALRAAGIEVWFDRSELVGGDAWDAKIRGQIASCALFIPVISANTQARLEGYFRLEWKLAAQRTHAMAAAKAFLLPVVIDNTRDADAHVPDEFKAVQWTRAPAGETTAAFCAHVLALANNPTSPPRPAADTRPAGPASRPRWMSWGLAGLGIAVALALWVRTPSDLTRHSTPAASVPASPPTRSPTAEKLAKLRLLTRWSETTPASLKTAEDILREIFKAEPDNADAWALAAKVDMFAVQIGLDSSDARRKSAIERIARAALLAPDSFEVRHVQAQQQALWFRSKDTEGLFRELVREQPDNQEVWEELGMTLALAGKTDEAVDALVRADRRTLAAIANLEVGRVDAGLRLMDEEIARNHSMEARNLKFSTQSFVLGDLDAGQATFDGFTQIERTRPEVAAAGAELALLRRDGRAVVDLLTAVPDAIIPGWQFLYPSGYAKGYGHTLLDQPEAALLEWQRALTAVRAELDTKPSDASLRGWEAVLLAKLGDHEAARRALRLYASYRRGFDAKKFDLFHLLTLSAIGDQTTETLDLVADGLTRGGKRDHVLYLRLRSSPEFDALRSAPRWRELLTAYEKRFPALIATTQPPPGRSPATAAGEKSVAVLAFTNLSSDKEQEYFSDGISEELLNVLAKVPGLKVTARTSSFFFKGKETPIPEIAKQLGVAYVVEGSVRKAGDKVRITAQLIKAADGFHVWSDTFTRDLKDIFAVQDEIAGLIAQNLRTQMASPSERPPVAPETYALILQARHAAAMQTNDGARQAIALYQQAVARDPKSADAWAEMALNYVQLARFGGMVTAEGMREARLAARRALDLDADHLPGLLALAWVQRTNDRDWRGAIATFRRALAVAPENVAAMSDAAICFLNVGFVAEAESLAARAAERDPLNPRAQWSRGAIFLWSGRAEQAVEAYRKAVALAPMGDEYHSHLARALAIAGRIAEAKQELPREPNERYRLVAQATVHYLAGERAEGDRAVQVISDKYGDQMAGYLANICALAGRVDDAFQWLERGYEARDASIAWAKTNTVYEGIRNDPRWEQFLRKMGLADDQLK